MLTTLLAMLLFAALFVAVGLLRTMDRGTEGCHGCSQAEAGGCAGSCPLMEPPPNGKAENDRELSGSPMATQMSNYEIPRRTYAVAAADASSDK